MIRLLSSDFKSSRFIVELVSFSASDKFNDYGTFTLEMLSSTDNELIRIGNYVISETFQGVIQDIQFDSEKVVAHGYSLNWLLDYRVIYTEEKYTESQDLMRSIVNLVKYYTAKERNLNFNTFELVIDDVAEDFPILNAEMSFSAGTGLGSCVCKACEEVGCGNRLYISNEDLFNKTPRLHFKLVNGKNRAIKGSVDSVLFSTDMMNLNSFSGKFDYSSYSNMVVVYGELTNGNTIVLPVESSEIVGEIRYSYVKADKQQSKTYDENGDEIKDSNGDSVEENQSDYVKRLQDKGKEKLHDNAIINSYTAEAEATGYGTRFNLGDYVFCYSSKYGIGFSAQVSTYTQTMDSTGNRKTVTLGSTVRRYR